MGDLIHRGIGFRMLGMRPAAVQLERAIYQLRCAELVAAVLHLQLLVRTADIFGDRVHGSLDVGSCLKLDATDEWCGDTGYVVGFCSLRVLQRRLKVARLVAAAKVIRWRYRNDQGCGCRWSDVR
jgi:hypothetical protein